MSTTYQIREVQPSEELLDEMAALAFVSTQDAAIENARWPRRQETRDAELQYRKQSYRDCFANPGKQYVFAVHDTIMPDGSSKQTIVGWAQWVHDAPPPPPAPLSEEEKEAAWQKVLDSLPEGMDGVAHRRIRTGLAKLDEQWLAGDDARNYWGLDILVVHPAHRRKGLGSRLVEWGMERAAKEGRGIGLTATPIGQPLYAGLGFKAYGEPFFILGDPYLGMRFDKPTISQV